MASSDPPPGTPLGTSADWLRRLREQYAWLRTVALARLGSAEAIDDVLQEVALAATKNADRLRDPDRLGAWLYRLTVVAALLYRRRMGRQRRHTRRYAEQLPQRDVVDADPLDWLASRERAAMVRQALTQLPPREAELLLLRYGHDWSYEQLGQRLGLSSAAIDGRLRRAKQRLRSSLLAIDRTLATTAT